MDGAVAGRVISVFSTGVVVATTSGQVEVLSNGDLYVGDQVTIEAGVAMKKQRGGETPIFYV